jgi:hypothetical protein
MRRIVVALGMALVLAALFASSPFSTTVFAAGPRNGSPACQGPAGPVLKLLGFC